MFTGIIEKIGQVLALEEKAGGLNLSLQLDLTEVVVGDSISVNGVCLTLAQFCSTTQVGQVFLSLETLHCSNLGGLKKGQWVNLERALPVSGRLNGHWVQGHVDGKAILTGIHPTGDSILLKFNLPSQLIHYCIFKGSIALDGISLTLNEVSHSECSVQIIPYTWHHTTLHLRRIGEEVNVEVDLLAKYMEKLCHPYPKLLKV